MKKYQILSCAISGLLLFGGLTAASASELSANTQKIANTQAEVTPNTYYDEYTKTFKVKSHRQAYMPGPHKGGFRTTNIDGISYYSTFRVDYSIGGNKSAKIELVNSSGDVEDDRRIDDGEGTIYFQRLNKDIYKLRVTNYNSSDKTVVLSVTSKDLIS